jgi:hypothetical protein
VCHEGWCHLCVTLCTEIKINRKMGGGGIQRLAATAFGINVGVELAHGFHVLQVIGLLEANETLGLFIHDGLDTVRLNYAANIGVGEDGTGEEVSVLDSGGLVGSSEDSVELLEGGLSPNDETAEVTSRCKEQEVQGRYTSNLNTSQISTKNIISTSPYSLFKLILLKREGGGCVLY